MVNGKVFCLPVFSVPKERDWCHMKTKTWIDITCFQFFALSYNNFESTVLYFDQQMHACACVRMVENYKKHLKMMKKIPLSSSTWEKRRKKFFAFICEPYVSLLSAWRKRYFFHHFRMFLIVFEQSTQSFLLFSGSFKKNLLSS